MTNKYFRIPALLGCAALIPSVDISAQSAPKDLIPVLVIIPSANNAPEHVVITRNSVDGYVITVSPQAANVQSLQAAVRQVTFLLDRDGDDDRSELTITIPKPTAAGRVRSTSKFMERLQASSPREVRRRGVVRMSHVYLPNAASRAALKETLGRDAGSP